MLDGFFREQALATQNRIDQLPQSMRVTSSLTRNTLGLLCAGLVVAAGWSAFVEVPIRVQGNGVFVDSAGDLLYPIRAPMDGVIEQLLVTEGARVKSGQAVARIQLPERQTALAKAERRLESLRAQHKHTVGLQAIERDGDDRARQVKIESLDRRISDLEIRLAWNRERENAQDLLLTQGVTTQMRAIEAKGAVLQSADQISIARGELSALLTDVLVSAGRRERERLGLVMQIEQAEAEIAALNAEISRGTVIYSSVDGTVGELSADRNGLVTPGQTIMSIVPTTAEGKIEAIAYISLSDGKLVKPGTQVLLRPGSLPYSEQSMLRGVVIDVSEAPVSERALTRTLGSSGLVSKASGGSAPFSVRISLQPDKKAASGYAWTSGTGPDIRLSPGTPVTARITVERTTLLSLAMPALRRWLVDKDDGWVQRSI